MTSERASSSGVSGSRPSSLVPLESCGKPLRLAESALQRKCHARWKLERDAVIDALLSGSKSEVKRAYKLQSCCAVPMVVCSSDSRVGLCVYSCRDRLCPRCSAGRSIAVARKVSAAIGCMSAPRQIELTVRHKNASLSHEIDRLMAAFRKLRKSSLWRSAVRSGVAVLEVTINEQTRCWHPHLHLVVDGDFIPQALLAKAWEDATGDSEVVWIQAVHDRDRAALYVAKYLAKSVRPSTLSSFEMRAYARALRGRRMLFGFGQRQSISRTLAVENKESREVRPVVSLQRLMDAASRGLDSASKALTLLCKASRTVLRLCQSDGSVVVSGDEQLSKAECEYVRSVCCELADEAFLLRMQRRPNKRDRKRRLKMLNRQMDLAGVRERSGDSDTPSQV